MRVKIENPGTAYAQLEVKTKWTTMTVDSIYVHDDKVGTVDIGMEDSGGYLNMYLDVEETKELIKFLQLQVDRAEKNIQE